MDSHTPTTKKHHKNYTPTHTPTRIHTHIHTTTQSPTIAQTRPSTHSHTHAEKFELVGEEEQSDEPEPSFTPPPMNLSDFMISPDPIPEQILYEQLYSSSVTSTKASSSSADGYVGFMFLLPIVILGAWFVQERVRRRHYYPIPDNE